MGFDIGGLVSQAGDYARNYLFYAQISQSPVGIEFSKTHMYLVSTAKLPAQTIEEISTDWQGMAYKIGGTTSFETLDIEFKCDPAQALRSQFLNWMRLVHDPISNIHGIPAVYFGKVGLSQLDGLGQPTASYDLIHAWPSTVSDVTLDYSDKSISKFTVTFTYLYHTMNTIFPTLPAAGATM
jgi:hypothetical protein